MNKKKANFCDAVNFIFYSFDRKSFRSNTLIVRLDPSNHLRLQQNIEVKNILENDNDLFCIKPALNLV